MIENFQKAENMLNQVTAIQRLINRLQSILAAPVNPYRVTLDNETKATIQSFRAEVQDHIDELSAQREKVLALVQQIQDGELRALLIMRYGLAEKCTEKTEWYKLEEIMHYGNKTLFRRHSAALAALEAILDRENA